jgi:hypothetical protein
VAANRPGHSVTNHGKATALALALNQSMDRWRRGCWRLVTIWTGGSIFSVITLPVGAQCIGHTKRMQSRDSQKARYVFSQRLGL